MPPADVALVAHMAGLDAVEWGSRAIAAQHEGTAKGAKLQAALKKALVLTGVALATSGAKAALITATVLNLLMPPAQPPQFATSYDV